MIITMKADLGFDGEVITSERQHLTTLQSYTFRFLLQNCHAIGLFDRPDTWSKPWPLTVGTHLLVSRSQR